MAQCRGRISLFDGEDRSLERERRGHARQMLDDRFALQPRGFNCLPEHARRFVINRETDQNVVSDVHRQPESRLASDTKRLELRTTGFDQIPGQSRAEPH